MKKKKYENVEQIVALIEKSLQPDARVEWNVQLPVINRPSKSNCQCDVVIRSGTKLRPHLSIVEVQARKSKVKINEFRGWLGKMKNTGAHSLICVSQSGFPKSIIEEAYAEGGRVKLIHLNDNPKGEIPINPLNSVMQASFWIPDQILKIEFNAKGFFPSPEEKAQLEQALIERATFKLPPLPEPLSLLEIIRKTLCNRHLEQRNTTIGFDGIIQLPDKNNIPSSVMLSVDCEFSWKKVTVDLNCSVASYEQLDDGTIAWFWSGRYNGEEGGFEAEIPITFDEDKNQHAIRAIRFKFADPIAFENIHINGVRET